MGKEFRFKFAIAQISGNPAYADELASRIQEPAFPAESEKVGLFTIAGIDEVSILRRRISEQYVSHLSRKLDAITRFCSSRGVELLVFPEYAIPPECLLALRQLSDELDMGIVAGSHTVTLNQSAQQVYRELGVGTSGVSSPSGSMPRARQALCVAFVPGGKTSFFTKYARSKWEARLELGSPALHSFQMEASSGVVEVQVLICAEAISEIQPSPEKHTHDRLIVIPAFTPSCEPFYAFAELQLLQGKCTCLANMAEFGGSKIFARCDRTNFWFTEKDGTMALPPSSEGVLIVEADLEKQFEIRKSTKEHTAVLDVKLYVPLYPLDSNECKQYAETAGVLSKTECSLEEAVDYIKPFTSLTAKVFPKLLQRKLEHFATCIATTGVVSVEEAREWIRPLTIADTPSTDFTRWDLCNEAIAAVNGLLVNEKYVSQSNELMEVLGCVPNSVEK